MITFDQLFRLLTNFEVKTLGKGAYKICGRKTGDHRNFRISL
ncbi:hypothetical protein LEP1GSC110_4384 [Leptospira interrogans serovar Medanensis str. UT053]|nr:hypothetical protein LEP1GSC110_4384 [Leptospira interrogans serovar Medanensis str. UT053]